jgi:hypothetical protein
MTLRRKCARKDAVGQLKLLAARRSVCHDDVTGVVIEYTTVNIHTAIMPIQHAPTGTQSSIVVKVAMINVLQARGFTINSGVTCQESQHKITRSPRSRRARDVKGGSRVRRAAGSEVHSADFELGIVVVENCPIAATPVGPRVQK